MRPYRKEKVASVVRRIVSEAIAQRLQDPRVSPLTTVTRVEMTDDLMIARVYLTTPGSETAERRTLAAVRHAAGYIQRMLAGGLSMRHCPELRFEIDKAAKGARRTLELLEENRRREPELFEPEGADAQTDAADAEHADHIGDDPARSPGVDE